jgi:hypothetical protein
VNKKKQKKLYPFAVVRAVPEWVEKMEVFSFLKKVIII